MLCQPSPFGFKVQYIGHERYVSPSDEQKRNFCETFWCTNDAFYLFEKSSQYLDQDPCVDFKNFSIGKAIEIDAVNDRLYSRGFLSLVSEKWKQRLRSILADKSDKGISQNRVFHVIKNTFRQCMKTSHSFRHLDFHRQVIDHLNSLGGSPYLSQHVAFNPNRFDPSKEFKFNLKPGNFNEILWNEENFNITKIFHTEPIHAFNVFLNYEIKRCSTQEYPDRNFICFSPIDSKFDWIEEDNLSWTSYKDTLETLEDIHLIAPQFKKILREEIIEPALSNLREYQLSRQKIKEKFVGEHLISEPLTRPKIFETDTYFIEIDIIDSYLEDFGLNWRELLNGLVLEDSKLEKNDFIIIQGLDLMKELMDNFKKTSKRVIADTFVLTYFYSVIEILIKHFHNRQIEVNQGRKKSFERWNTCYGMMYFENSALNPAILSLYESQRPFYDYFHGDFERDLNASKNIINEAESFIREAVDVVIQKFIEGNNFPIGSALKVLDKLTTLNIVIGMSEKILPIQRLEEIYKEMRLSGNENLLKTVREMQLFTQKIKNAKKGNFLSDLIELADIDFMIYRADINNTLYVPPVFILYPYYHPLRPRFFNMATLYNNVLYSMSEGILKLFLTKEVFIDVYNKNPFLHHYNQSSFYTGIDDPRDIAYFEYKKWLQTHDDLQIGANYLTNLQLYFVANAVITFSKFSSSSTKDKFELKKLNEEYMHVSYKATLYGFSDAFGCFPTEEDLRIYKEYSDKFWEISNKQITTVGSQYKYL